MDAAGTQNFHPFIIVGIKSSLILDGMSDALPVSARFQENTVDKVTGARRSWLAATFVKKLMVLFAGISHPNKLYQ